MAFEINNIFRQSVAGNQGFNRTNTKKKDTVSSDKGTAKTDSIQISNSTKKSLGLSDDAQSYLSSLKEKYGDMEFVVSDFSSNEQANSIMSKVKTDKTYVVVITPDMLEEMAGDKEKAKANEAVFDSVSQSFDTLNEAVGEDKDSIEKLGISVDTSGKVSYYAVMNDTLDKMNEMSDKANKTEKKSSLVKAESIEELIEKIKAKKAEEKEKLENASQDEEEQAKPTLNITV